MTTVVSIAGKDPETNELYVLIAADSRGSLSGRNIDDNEKKIFVILMEICAWSGRQMS
jgi:hypothetical protein